MFILHNGNTAKAFNNSFAAFYNRIRLSKTSGNKTLCTGCGLIQSLGVMYRK